MNKKIFFISIFLIFFSFSTFSYENVAFSEWTKEYIINDDPDFFETKEVCIFKLDNQHFACLSEFCFFYITDNKSFIRELDVGCCTIKNYGQTISKQLQQFRLGNFYTYVLDCNYDEKLDLINYSVSGMAMQLLIKTLDTDKSLFESEMHKSYKNIDIIFCIINNKRGFKFKEPDENGIPKWSFFYWSPTEQRYILDETVTQAQIENAYCPEEYFAYNGLDFSKLDKPLKKTDLQNLTPAQLRLMRNAIYARHGRTFNSVDLQSLWECYTWYKPNSDYTDDMLTKTDKKNIKLIQEQEKITGVYTPDLPKK